MFIFRVGSLFAASLAAFAISQIIGTHCSKRKIKNSEKNGSSLQQIEGEEKIQDYSNEKMQEEEEAKWVRKEAKQGSNADFPISPDCRKSDEPQIQRKSTKDVVELELLSGLVKEIEQRKETLERKLLELHSLKEQQSYITHLQKQLNDKITELAKLNFTVDLIREEIINLQGEIQEGLMAEKQLKIEKKRIHEMQMKMNANTSHVKGHLMMLEEQISGFSSYNTSSSFRNAIIEKKVISAKGLELEVVEIKRRNKELELEKREFAVKLIAAQAKITALSKMTENKIIEKIKEELRDLRNENEELSKEVEKLQKSRFNMVEELVYQRWLNACLRFESLNDQTLSRTSSSSRHDLSSSTLESDEIDTSTIESTTSSSQKSIMTKKYGLVHKIKQWARSKNDTTSVSSPDKSSRQSSLTKTRLVRRFSTSMIPSKSSLLNNEGDYAMQDSTRSVKTPISSRVRRVSFNDSVKSVSLIKQDTLKEKLNIEETIIANFELDEEKDKSCIEGTIDSSVNSLDKDNMETQVAGKLESARNEEFDSRISSVVASEKKDDSCFLYLIAALLLFMFMLLVVFMVLSAKLY